MSSRTSQLLSVCLIAAVGLTSCTPIAITRQDSTGIEINTRAQFIDSEMAAIGNVHCANYDSIAVLNVNKSGASKKTVRYDCIAKMKISVLSETSQSIDIRFDSKYDKEESAWAMAESHCKQQAMVPLLTRSTGDSIRSLHFDCGSSIVVESQTDAFILLVIYTKYATTQNATDLAQLHCKKNGKNAKLDDLSDIKRQFFTNALFTCN